MFYVVGSFFIWVGILMVVRQEAPPVGWGFGDHPSSIRRDTDAPLARGLAAVAIGIWDIFIGLIIIFGS